MSGKKSKVTQILDSDNEHKAKNCGALGDVYTQRSKANSQRLRASDKNLWIPY